MTTICIVRGEIVHLKIPLLKPFVTSFGSLNDRDIILVSFFDKEGRRGWGEAPVLALPLYNPEVPESVMAVLKQVIFPLMKDREFESPAAMNDALSFMKGNEFAKSAVIMAGYDLWGKMTRKSLAEMIGGTKQALTISGTISIHDSPEDMLEEAKGYYRRGIRYLKLKIRPRYDVSYAKYLREKLPDAALMLDANASYMFSKDTLTTFKACDPLNLYCVEQPLQGDDLIDHAKLQAAIRTKVALDESIKSIYDVEKALELGSCKLVNVKIPRVGGMVNALAINAYCAKHTVPTWVGGMLESPVGFYANLALATVPNFDYPVDFLGALDYMKDYEHFFNHLPFQVSGGMMIPELAGPGLGLDLDWDLLNSYCVERIPLS